MSLSISAVSASNIQHDTELSLKPSVAPATKLSLKPAVAPPPAPPVKPSQAQQIEQLAIQGQSAQQIATAIGLPESLVNLDLGTTSTSTTSPTSQASAVLAVAARLSVQA
jgi:hypothetical protein